MSSQMDRYGDLYTSEGDFTLWKLEMIQDCMPLSGGLLLSFKWGMGLEQLVSFNESSYSFLFLNTVLGQYIFYYTESCFVPWIILEDKPACTLRVTWWNIYVVTGFDY